MHIYEYYIENYLKIKNVEIKTEDNVIIITGQNGEGKSSLIEGIFTLFTGKVPKKPIREGCEKAVIQLKTGEYDIEKIITEAGAKLTLKDKDGHIIKKPQTILNEALGTFSMDPMEFHRMDNHAKRDTLLSIANISLDDVDARRETAYQERRDIGRDLNRAESHFKSIEISNEEMESAPEEVVELAELNEKQNELIEKIQYQNKLAETIEDTEEKILSLRAELESYEKEVEQCQKQIIDLDEYKGLEIERDVTTDKINHADEINRLYYLKQDYIKASDQVTQLENARAHQDEIIKECDKEKEDMIHSAELPLKGLGVDETGITYDGHPFDQLSKALQIKISVSLAMASNPEVRVLKIMDGSLLDKKSMDTIKELANEHNFQVWVEVVGDDPEAGIMLHDGEVVTEPVVEEIPRRKK